MKFKTTFYLIIFTLTAKVIGFSREIVLAYYYGASQISDAYIIARTIPVTLFDFFSLAIATTFIPIARKIMVEKGRSYLIDFTSSFLNLMLIFVSVIILFINVFPDFFVSLFAKGFDIDTFNLTVRYIRIASYSLIGTTVVFVVNAYLHSNNIFYPTSFVGIPQSIGIIVIIIISSKYQPILPYAFLAGSVLMSIYLLYFGYKNGLKIKLKLNIKDRYLLDLLLLGIPIMISSSANQINILIDRNLASTLAAGTISAMNYATRINTLLVTLFVLTTTTVFFPVISKMYSEGKMDKFKQTINDTASFIIMTILPVSIFIIIYSTDIISVIFGRGEFDFQAIIITSNALKYYIIGLVGYSLKEVFSKVYYSTHNTIIPTIITIITIVVNITLNFLLIDKFGYIGLAFATSISGLLAAFLLLIIMVTNKNIGRSFLVNATKSLLVAAIIYISLIMVTRYITFNNPILDILMGTLIFLLILVSLFIFLNFRFENISLNQIVYDKIKKIKNKKER